MPPAATPILLSSRSSGCRERVVGHRLRIDVQAESPIPLDDDTVRRDLADEATVACAQAGFRIISVEHDHRAHAHARSEAGCEVTCTSCIHGLIFVRSCRLEHPPKEAGAAQLLSNRKRRRRSGSELDG